MEFLIKRIDGDWFSFNGKFADVVTPHSIPSEPEKGYGDARIKTSLGVISFSYEDPGVQIVFEDDIATPEQALTVVEEILHNIEMDTKQKGQVVKMS